MKYPPYSWLRLSDKIEKSPSRIWFSFNRLPQPQKDTLVTVHIGSDKNSITDIYELKKNVILPRQQKVLDILLKDARPTRNKAEFFISHACFSKILPFCTAIPFEVQGLGILNKAKQSARIKAFVKKKENNYQIEFALVTSGLQTIKTPSFYGDINTYVLSEEAKVFSVSPLITTEETQAIITSPPLELLGLYQRESREIFYALSKLGVDFSSLNEVAIAPDACQIYLRLLLDIDDLTGKLCARVHLVTHISHGSFEDEVEIKSTGTIPSVHIALDDSVDEENYIERQQAPQIVRRPHTEEENARQYMLKLGAGPSRHHDGFELSGESALSLIKAIGENQELPSYIKLDKNTQPNIIKLPEMPTLRLKASSKGKGRVDVSLHLSPEFDEENIPFSMLKNAKENILVLNEDTLVILNEKVELLIDYFMKNFGLTSTTEVKDKPIVQIVLICQALKELIKVEMDEEIKKLIKEFSLETTDQDRVLPSDLRPTLRKYQHEAVAWLSSMFRAGIGCLLGDEMGLGKTLMVLTHLAKLKEEKLVSHPALVVCPTSVIDVWVDEAKRHIPSLVVEKWHGTERHSKKSSLKGCDIIITSYAILRRDIDTFLKETQFSSLILDEAQYIRNQQTDSFKSAKALNCAHKIALTGTPIENKVTDLYNILDCVEDGILGSKTSFERQFCQKEPLNNKSSLSLRMLLSPVVMRRKKNEVEEELPPKIENIVHCDLSDLQRKLYNEYVAELTGTLAVDSEKGSNNHFSLLSSLTRLRQICCHPGLIDESFNAIEDSGKLITLKETIAECLEIDRKIIIYSQFLKMQEFIVKIAKELDPKGALWLHGSTKNRDEIVKDFQNENGPNIIVVSLKAGGTGITLTRADTVIFADPWWNPAVEDQAVDRAHRIGQKKTVHVIRLIADDSIECEVLGLSERKREAANSVLKEGFKASSSLTKDEIKSLLLHEIDRVRQGEND